IGIYGAIISTILAELFVTTTRFTSFVRETSFRLKLKNIVVYFLSGILMILAIRYISGNMSPSPFTTLVQVIIGSLIYMFLTTILKVNPLIAFIKKKNNS
ncbi:polysaccharide biosynthesis C-terminal domain-containing protein, partial [Enterococcus faecium]|nr:polysaccharide biosynthesis C-terminal domain-containing protein [Enterococcus faecium]